MVGNADSRLFNIAKYIHRLLADNDSRDAISLRMLDHLQEIFALAGHNNRIEDLDPNTLHIFGAITPNYQYGIFVMQHDKEPFVAPLGTLVTDSNVAYCRLIHTIIDSLISFTLIPKFQTINIYLPSVEFKYAAQSDMPECKQIMLLRERLEELQKAECSIGLCYEPLGLIPETKLLKAKVTSLSR